MQTLEKLKKNFASHEVVDVDACVNSDERWKHGRGKGGKIFLVCIQLLFIFFPVT